MAKKQETKKEVEVPVVETPVVETPKPKKVEIKKPEWEIKDRVYYLKDNKKPLSYMIRSSNIYYFDEEKGYERELKYCQNQQTCFVDEMKGDQRLSHIIFRNGALFVEKSKGSLNFIILLNFFFNKLNCSSSASEPVISISALLHSSIKKPFPDPISRIFIFLVSIDLIFFIIFLKLFFLTSLIPSISLPKPGLRFDFKNLH